MATTTGTLTSKVSSTVSSPTVNYSATYTATRASTSTAAVSVDLTFSAWLGSSGSKLGTGIKLTVFARLNGGAWKSVVIKNTSASWSGTTKHTANLTLTGSAPANTAKIEFYVSRTGSTYSGSAGILGSAANPLRYTVSLPAYTPGKVVTPTPSTVDAAHYACVNIGGAWKKAIPYVRIAGTWKQAVPYVRVNGVWKST